MMKQLTSMLLIGLASCYPSNASEISTERQRADISFEDLPSHERVKLRAYLDKQVARVSGGWTRVIKEDLDGDGKPEYVVTVELARDTGKKGVRVFAVVKDVEANTRLITYAPENTDPGLGKARKIFTVDFDGDGKKDVVEQRGYPIGGSSPERYCLILKYDGESLKKVYSAWAHNDCSLVDLDGDGKLELIESTNEFQVPIHPRFLWPVVNQWRDGRWQPAPEAFPDFYQRKVQLYADRLELAREKAALSKDIFRESSLPDLNEEIVKVMETYLARVKKIVGQK